MLTKIKSFSIIPVLVLSLQTTIFAMETPQTIVLYRNPEYFFKQWNNRRNTFTFLQAYLLKNYLDQIKKNSHKAPKAEPTFFEMDTHPINSDGSMSDRKQWAHEIKTNPLKSQFKLISMYKKINSKNHPSSIPYYVSYRLNPLDFFSSLKQMFSKEDLYDVKITLHTIKSDLTRLITYLKNNDLQNKTLIQEEINNKYKQLWNDYLTLHNYNWLDHIMYPCHPNINDQEEGKYRRKQLFSLHSDKKTSEINRLELDELYKHLTDLSRPKKSMDFIIDPIVAFAASTTARAGFQVSAQAVTTACSLPSLLFPDYFTNKHTAHYKAALNKTNKDIKIVELNIQAKQQEARDAVKFFSTKNKNVRTN